MSDGLWLVVLGVGIVQGTFLSVTTLVQSHANRRAARRLAAIVAVVTAILLGEALGIVLSGRAAQFIIFVNINTELALGPLFLLFVRSLLDSQREWERRDAWHFLPVGIGFVGWGVAWQAWPAIERESRFFALTVIPAFVAFKAILLIAYLAASYRSISSAAGASGGPAAEPLPLDPRAVQRWIVAMGSLAGVIYGTVFLQRWTGRLPFEPDQLGSLILAAATYLASFLVAVHPGTLSVRPHQGMASRWSVDAALVTSHLDRERPWLDPELDLGALARSLGLTRNHLSSVINQGLGTTFHELLNRYRLAEFERLAGDEARRHHSVLDLALDAGFRSKATFYRAFSEAHDETPASFRANRGYPWNCQGPPGSGASAVASSETIANGAAS